MNRVGRRSTECNDCPAAFYSPDSFQGFPGVQQPLEMGLCGANALNRNSLPTLPFEFEMQGVSRFLGCDIFYHKMRRLV